MLEIDPAGDAELGRDRGGDQGSRRRRGLAQPRRRGKRVRRRRGRRPPHRPGARADRQRGRLRRRADRRVRRRPGRAAGICARRPRSAPPRRPRSSPTCIPGGSSARRSRRSSRWSTSTPCGPRRPSMSGGRFDLLVAGELNPDAIVLARDDRARVRTGRAPRRRRRADRRLLGGDRRLRGGPARDAHGLRRRRRRRRVRAVHARRARVAAAIDVERCRVDPEQRDRPQRRAQQRGRPGDPHLASARCRASPPPTSSDEMLAAAEHLHVSSPHLQSGLRDGLAELFARAHEARSLDLARSRLGPERKLGRRPRGCPRRRPTSSCRTPPRPARSPASRSPRRRSKRSRSGSTPSSSSSAPRARSPGAASETARRSAAGRRRSTPPARATASPPASSAASAAGVAGRGAAARRRVRVALDPRPRWRRRPAALAEALEVADAPSRRAAIDRGGRDMSGPKIGFIGAGQRRVHRDADRRHPRLSRAARGDDLAPRHRPRAPRDRRGRRPGDRRPARRGARRSRPISSAAPRSTGADYVINMIQVGGHAATVIDHEIPARYGLRQTIGDTLGVGGVFRALRTIPVMEGIAARHGRGLPRRLAAQLHQPDGDALLGDLRGHAPAADRRALPLGPEHDRASSPSSSGCRSRRSRSSAPASTTRRSSCASSATARTSTRCSTRRSSAIPSCCAGSGCRCTGGSATSRPSRASTRPSTCRGCMRDDEAIERYRLWVAEYVARSEENLAEYERDARAARGVASRSSSSPATSTRRRSSTRSRPDARG